MNNLTKMTITGATVLMGMAVNFQDASACGLGMTDFKTTAILNVRTQPSTSTGVVVKKLPKGTIVRPTEITENRQWVKIDAGWVSFNYLEQIVHNHGENTQSNQNSNNAIKLNNVAYKVTVSSLNARTGPGTQYGVEKFFQKGQVLVAYEQQGSWLKVEDGHINDVWVHMSYVELYKDSQQSVTVNPSVSINSETIALTRLEVTSDTLNIRKTPSASGQLMGQFKRGDEVSSTEKVGTWYAITMRSGEKGWINGAFTKRVPMSMNATYGDLVDTPNREDKIRTVSVGKGNTLNVMFGDFEGSGLKAKLIDGNKVEVLSEKNGTAYIKYNHYINGVARVAMGYVEAKYLK